jgi:thioredoxin reductase (NADPH)
MSNAKIAIIGSGPSGLTAGIYTSRANLDTTIYLGLQPGGQLTTTTEIENFPGAWSNETKEGMMGPDLMTLMQQQAEHFGAVSILDEIKSIEVAISKPTILFATHNPSKVERMRKFLGNQSVNLKSPVELNLESFEVDENGETEMENAQLKAEAFFNKYNIVSIALDSGLYFEGVDESEQPGRHIQRIAGAGMGEDDEKRFELMTNHYINLAKKYGGSVRGYFLDAYSLFNGKEHVAGVAKRYFVLRDQQFHKDVHFPIACLYTVNGKPVKDLTNEEEYEFVKPAMDCVNHILNQYLFTLKPKLKISTSGTSEEFDAVIIASGASAKYIGLEGEEKYIGKGYHSCATCDGFFYRKKTICVVGGGDSAMEEANFLTKFADKVYLIHRSESFRASKIMVDRAKANPKIEFVMNTKVTKFIGEEKVEGVVLENTKDGSTRDLKLDGVFVAIGHTPNTGFVGNLLDKDDAGYLVSQGQKDADDRTSKFLTAAQVPGIFIAGDVEDKIYRQAITAAGNGCKAAIDCERWLESVE